MPNLKIVIPHNLSKEEVLKRIKNFLLELTSRHSDKISDLQESWSEYTCIFNFLIKGLKVNGSLIVEDKFILIKGKIPLIAELYKNQIENIIRHQVDSILSK